MQKYYLFIAVHPGPQNRIDPGSLSAYLLCNPEKVLLSNACRRENANAEVQYAPRNVPTGGQSVGPGIHIGEIEEFISPSCPLIGFFLSGSDISRFRCDDDNDAATSNILT